MTTSGWDGILDDDEEILWQGRPDRRIVLRPRNIGGLLFGLLFAGFALFWMIMAAQAGGMFWMFGLLHFSIGLAVAGGAIYLNAFVRSRSWYTLTNRRAFIATDLPLVGKRLKSYPIDGDTVLEFEQGDPASIYFAQERKRNNNGTTRVQKIGFERVENGQDLLRLFRDIQRNATS